MSRVGEAGHSVGSTLEAMPILILVSNRHLGSQGNVIQTVPVSGRINPSSNTHIEENRP